MDASSPENVADLIAKPPEEYPPEARYVSKYRDKIVEASKLGKSAHKTMGVPPMDPDMPVQYLKKRSDSAARKKAQIDREHHPRPSYQRRLSAARARQQKDLKSKSAKEAKKPRPSRARRGLWCVDDRYGNSYPVMLSGMFPVYRNREGFGKVPGTYPVGKNALKKFGDSILFEPPVVEVSKPRKSKRLEKSPRRGRSPGKKEQLDKSKLRGTRAREKSGKREGTSKVRGVQDKSKKSRKIEKSPKRSMAEKKKRGQRVDDKNEKKQAAPTGKERTKSIVKKKAEVDEKVSEKSLEEENSQVAEHKSREKKKEEGKEAENSEREESETSSESESESKDESLSDIEDSTTSTTFSSKTKKSETSTATTIPYQQPRCRYVDEDERAELLHGMKKKWDEMMTKFQSLPFVIDTQPKKKRKSQMEKELLQLEKDIKTIEQHPYIYVYSDSDD